jgi:hypothetical protein
MLQHVDAERPPAAYNTPPPPLLPPPLLLRLLLVVLLQWPAVGASAGSRCPNGPMSPGPTWKLALEHANGKVTTDIGESRQPGLLTQGVPGAARAPDMTPSHPVEDPLDPLQIGTASLELGNASALVPGPLAAR